MPYHSKANCNLCAVFSIALKVLDTTLKTLEYERDRHMEKVKQEMEHAGDRERDPKS